MADEIEGTTTTDVETAPEGEPTSDTVATTEDGSTPAATTQAAEKFLGDLDLDPEKMSPENKEHFKRMQAHYTKFNQGRKSLEEKATLVDRFYSDEAYRREFVKQEAQRLGLLTPKEAEKAMPSPSTAQPSQVPASFLAAYKANLPPELQWMAEATAGAQYAAMQEAMKPLFEERTREASTKREQEYDTLATKLSETAPGWEQYEKDMNGLHEFLRSPALTHPQYGDKLTLLYKLATGEGRATAEAAARMGKAVQNKTTSSQQGRKVQPNITEQVRKAKSTREAFAIAAKAAAEEMGMASTT